MKGILFGLMFMILPTLAFAAGGYQPLSPLPSTDPNSVEAFTAVGEDNLVPYLQALYKFGVAAAAGLAVVMVIWGGVEYITSVAGEGKSGGKERITSAILGL